MAEQFAHPVAELSTLSPLPGPQITKQPAAGHAAALDPSSKLRSRAVGLIKGQVDSTGAKIGGDTDLFSVNHSGTGVYIIAFGVGAFAAAPTITDSVGAQVILRVTAKTNAGFTASTFNLAGAAVDAAFDFVAYA